MKVIGDVYPFLRDDRTVRRLGVSGGRYLSTSPGRELEPVDAGPPPLTGGSRVATSAVLWVERGSDPAATTTFDAANRPTSGTNPTAAYTSDDDGRLTARPNQTMTWDHLGRLTAVKNAAGTLTLAAYTYDPLDRLRMIDYGAGVRTRFRYVGLTTSAAQLIDDAAGTVSLNIGNGWSGERLLDWTGSGSNIRIYGTNDHHDVTWLASSTGTVSQSLRYDPWGNPRSTVPGGYTPFRFQGSLYDDHTDLSWVVTRWYAPALGTFISEDSLLGEPRAPDSRHLYAYGHGDPVGSWDRDGRVALLGDSGSDWDLSLVERQDVTGFQFAVLQTAFNGLCTVAAAATLVLATLVGGLCLSGALAIDHMGQRIYVRQVNYRRVWKRAYYNAAVRIDARPAVEIRQGGTTKFRVAQNPRVRLELHFAAYSQQSKADYYSAAFERHFQECGRALDGDSAYQWVREHKLHWGNSYVNTCGAYSGEIKTWKDPWKRSVADPLWGDRNVTVVDSPKWPDFWRSGMATRRDFWRNSD